jgi:thiamine biosynthesis protein ThiS
MTLQVNGQPIELPEGATVRDLLVRLNLGQSPCAVEVNKALVRKPDHDKKPLAPADTVEIVTLVGGG